MSALWLFNDELRGGIQDLRDPPLIKKVIAAAALRKKIAPRVGSSREACSRNVG